MKTAKEMDDKFYVSFEAAKALRWAGFNEEVKTYYTYDGKARIASSPFNWNQTAPEGLLQDYSRPLLAEATEWLKKMKDVGIVVYRIYNTIQYRYFIYEGIALTLSDKTAFSTQEEAINAAIIAYLNNEDKAGPMENHSQSDFVSLLKEFKNECCSEDYLAEYSERILNAAKEELKKQGYFVSHNINAGMQKEGCLKERVVATLMGVFNGYYDEDRVATRYNNTAQGIIDDVVKSYYPMAFKGHKDYEKGYADGNTAAKNAIPKWKIAERDFNSDTIDFAIKYKHDGGDNPDYESVEVTNRIRKGEEYFELSDLGEKIFYTN